MIPLFFMSQICPLAYFCAHTPYIISACTVYHKVCQVQKFFCFWLVLVVTIRGGWAFIKCGEDKKVARRLRQNILFFDREVGFFVPAKKWRFKMKVKELIKELNNYAQDFDVEIEGNALKISDRIILSKGKVTI